MPAQHPQKTLADRVVAWFAPGAAVRRAQARAVLAYFEAARPDRLRKGRRATGSVNDDVLRAGSTLREIARHMEQNYDLALGVLNTLVANVVGANGIGIEPQPRNADGSINDDLARQILELFKDWATCPEVTRQHDWPSAQRMLARSWLRDGEVFAQLVAGLLPSLDHGTRVPFSLEMLEADYVPMGKQSSGPATINQGIEINAWGAPVAYHVLRDAPESAASITTATKRVAADRMLHLKNVHRIRQLRGVSVFASVLNRFDDLKDYEESERIAAKIAASMAAYIKKGAPDIYNPDGTADDAPRQMKFRPGMVFDDLKVGEEIGMIDTNRPNPNLETYRSGQMKAIAAGTCTLLGVTIETASMPSARAPGSQRTPSGRISANIGCATTVAVDAGVGGASAAVPTGTRNSVDGSRSATDVDLQGFTRGDRDVGLDVSTGSPGACDSSSIRRSTIGVKLNERNVRRHNQVFCSKGRLL